MKEKSIAMRYKDELDKSYGVAGMVLGLSALDAANLYTAVTLDGGERGSIKFTPEFYFAGNPRLSPRGAWQYMVGHYRVSVGLAVANALCRRMVLENSAADRDLRESLLNAACDDGREYCNLERDEVEAIFDEAFESMSRLFADTRVRRVVDMFVDALRQRRNLSHIDVDDLLSQVGVFQ